MNRINKLFQEKNTNILSVYFTAGHPSADSTGPILKFLQDAGTDMIEIGIPFSDPMADGPVIQASSSTALKNGMSLRKLFTQIKNVRKEIHIPLLLMGYLNPVLQYGIDRFCADCQNSGIDGVILPDLPLDVYNSEYSELFCNNGLINVFLITPQTSEARIRMIDDMSNGFIYMVSSSSTTGIRNGFNEEQKEYFGRIREMKLKNPVVAGFGISGHETFKTVCRFANGAIIGSAFVKMLSDSANLEVDIPYFIKSVIGT